MTIKEFKNWDGFYTAVEKDNAVKNEKAMLKAMPQEVREHYFNLVELYVYGEVDGLPTKTVNAVEKALNELCNAYNFTLKECMVAY